MSSSKLKRDIKVLEKQLEEIDINISDPIERIGFCIATEQFWSVRSRTRIS
jgi:hypothetical protein